METAAAKPYKTEKAKRKLDESCIFGDIAKCANIKEIFLDNKIRARYQARANILKALAHPTRLYIVDVLSRGEKCVCELTSMVGADMSTVSKHLAILRNAGIIQDRKRGPQVYYELKMPCVLNFFECAEAIIEATAREQLRSIK